MLLRYDRYARFDRRPLMLRSAMIQPNLARSSVIKMRGRRSSCSETRTCATNLASFGGVGRPRAQDYLQAIRVGRRQTQNSRRSWKEIRSDQRADPAVAEYRPGETASGARQEGEADRTARPNSIPQTRLSRSLQDASSRGQSYHYTIPPKALKRF